MHTIEKNIQNTERIPDTPMRFLWFVTKPHKQYFGIAVLGVTCAVALSTSLPYIFKSIIDSAQGVETGSATLREVWRWVIAYPLITLAMFAAWRVSGFTGGSWATSANVTAYESLFTHLTKHSHTYFSNRFAGSISSKMTHASEGVQSLAEGLLWNYYHSALSLVLTVLYLATSSVLAAGLFLALILTLIPFNLFLVQRRRPHVVAYAEQATRSRGYAVDAITNISAVRQFARMPFEHTRFAEHVRHMGKLNIRQWHISEWGLLANNVIIVLFEICILYIAVTHWIGNTLSTGDLIMVVTLMMNVQQTLVFIGSSMNGFIRRYADIQEGLTDILIDHDIVDCPDTKPLSVSTGEIVWNDVTFKYEENTVFEHFNLTIRAGERVGLVGSSGAGKTTFVSLVLRQHELNGGTISIDQQDIARVTQDSLREHIAVVPQEPLLFHRTVRENIVYGKPDATDEEVFAVAQRAQAHEFISQLAHGYDTLVGERGVKLSGGQKQRIAIARAMLKDAPILILDEATSALDSESEVAIQKALHELMEGKTVVAIAHRLSTLREMDRIVVLENGKIVEDGTHETLTKAGGLYARLWEHQAGGFLQE